jgi:hypothetical protein
MNAQKIRVVNGTRFSKGVELIHPLLGYIKLHEARFMMGQFHKFYSSLSQFGSTSTRLPVTVITVNFSSSGATAQGRPGPPNS